MASERLGWPVRGALILVDGADAGLSTMWPGGLSHMNRIVNVEQDHFPGWSSRYVVYNQPWVFSKIMALFKGVMNKATQEKLVVIKSGRDAEELNKYASPAQRADFAYGTCVTAGAPIMPGGAVPDHVMLDSEAAWSVADASISGPYATECFADGCCS